MLTDLLPVVLLLLVPVLAGSAICLGELRNLHFGRASTRWPTAPGEVLTAEIHRGGPGNGDEAAAVAYAYHVAGRRYVSRRLSYTGWGASDRWQVVQQFPPGTAVVVAYDAEAPARAVLRPGVSRGTFVRLALGGALLFGPLGLLAAAVLTS